MSTKRRKSWRCFHCDEVFRSRKSAWAHFGPDDELKDVPACIDPLRADEKARMTELRSAQEYAKQCQESANIAEDKLDDAQRELDAFKGLTKCCSSHDLRIKQDSEEGERITARVLIEAVRTKAPEIYADIIQ